MTLRIVSGLAEQARRGQLTQEPGVPTCQCPNPHLWLMTVGSCAVALNFHTADCVPVSLTFLTAGQGQIPSSLPFFPQAIKIRSVLIANFKEGADLNSGYTDEDGISAEAFPPLQWHLCSLSPGSGRHSLREDRLSLAHGLRGLLSRMTEVTSPCMAHLSLRGPVYVGRNGEMSRESWSQGQIEPPEAHPVTYFHQNCTTSHTPNALNMGELRGTFQSQV